MESIEFYGGTFKVVSFRRAQTVKHDFTANIVGLNTGCITTFSRFRKLLLRHIGVLMHQVVIDRRRLRRIDSTPLTLEQMTLPFFALPCGKNSNRTQ
jgi:hypothetical protein